MRTLKTTLNSHDRIMTAIDLMEPDHVPLYFAVMGRGEAFDPGYGFTFKNINRFDVRFPYSHRHQLKKVEEMLALGVDDMVRLEPPLGWAEEYVVEGVEGIKADLKNLTAESGGLPVLEKIYQTPAGELRTIVKTTDDWPHGENIPVFSDYNVSRAREYLIKERSDIPRLKALLREPKRKEYQRYKEEAPELREAARKLGVVFEGGRTVLGDSLIWLLGIERLIYGSFDDPGFIAELLDTICSWEKRRLSQLLDENVELVFHSAWYEITDFWTPELYRAMLKPRLKELIEMTHQAGAKFAYIITKSYDALADDLLELGPDCLYGADPLQGKADIDFFQKKLKGRVCLWGGLSSAVTLGKGTKAEIEGAVEESIVKLAPGGGFVLFPVDNIIPDANPWEKTKILLEKWSMVGSYPILTV